MNQRMKRYAIISSCVAFFVSVFYLFTGDAEKAIYFVLLAILMQLSGKGG